MNEILRKKVKLLKANLDIKYLEIAEYLEVKPNSFYNWLKGQYDFCFDTQLRLNEIISNLWEG